MTDLEGQLDTMLSDIESADISGAQGMIEDIESFLNSFDSLITDLEGAADALGDLMEMSVDMGQLSALEGSEGDVQTAIDQVEESAEICAELISELFGLIEDWKSDHPWWDD